MPYRESRRPALPSRPPLGRKEWEVRDEAQSLSRLRNCLPHDVDTGCAPCRSCHASKPHKPTITTTTIATTAMAMQPSLDEDGEGFKIGLGRCVTDVACRPEPWTQFARRAPGICSPCGRTASDA